MEQKMDSQKRHLHLVCFVSVEADASGRRRNNRKVTANEKWTQLPEKKMWAKCFSTDELKRLVLVHFFHFSLVTTLCLYAPVRLRHKTCLGLGEHHGLAWNSCFVHHKGLIHNTCLSCHKHGCRWPNFLWKIFGFGRLKHGWMFPKESHQNTQLRHHKHGLRWPKFPTHQKKTGFGGHKYNKVPFENIYLKISGGVTLTNYLNK